MEMINLEQRCIGRRYQY